MLKRKKKSNVFEIKYNHELQLFCLGAEMKFYPIYAID